MLQFAVFTDHRRLAIAFSVRRRDAERGNAFVAQQPAQFLANRHQFFQILAIAARERIFDNGDRCGAACRRIYRPADFDVGPFDDRDDFPDFCLAHLNPSSPTISEVFSPPAR